MKGYQIHSYNKNWTIFLLLAPAILFTIATVGYGLVLAFLQTVPGENGVFTVYGELFQLSRFKDSFLYSVKIAAFATIFSLLIGLFVAKVIFSILKDSLGKILVWAPMLIPHFVAAYIILFFFGQSGWFSSLLYQLDIISEMNQFPILVFDHGGIGIILSYVWKSVPFVVLIILPAFYEMNRQYVDVVKILGGSRFHVFKTVEWPWLFPLLLESGIILFAFILAAFEVPYLLGVTNPKMISVLSYQWYYDGTWAMRPGAIGALLLTSLFIIVITIFLFLFIQKSRFKMMKGRSS